MEAPPNIKDKLRRNETFQKNSEKNESYTLNIKLENNDSIYISITLQEDNKSFEDIKLYGEIKREQAYFEDYSLEEIYDEISDLIAKNNIEFNKNNDQILFKIILPSKKKKTLDFVLENKKIDNSNNSIFQQIIKEKNYTIKQLQEIIKQKDEIIKEKNDIINDLKEINNRNKDSNNIIERKEDNSRQKENGNIPENIDYNEIFQDFNIINRTPKNKLAYHGNNSIYTIIQLQDGRLASGGNDRSIIIYNQNTFEPEITIKEHSKGIFDIIQLKNGNLISCSYDDKTINEYENKTYRLISQIKVGKDKSPRQIKELNNGQIGLVASNSIIFYLNLNNKLDEDFIIKSNDNQIGKYYEMLQVNPEEIVISGENDKIQFFEINSRKLKEIINIYRDIHWSPGNVLCMINEKCLCVGGQDKITLIDVYNKNIIREFIDNGIHQCILKLNDNILLTGKNNGDITQWKINENNLIIISKKGKAHQNTIREIIRFNNLLISCSSDYSIKIW